MSETTVKQGCRDCGESCEGDADYCGSCAALNAGDYVGALAYAEAHPATIRRPGKFEGCDDQRVGMVLHAMAGDQSYWDASASDESGEWYCAIGRYVVSEDDRGFFWYIREGSADVARAKVESLDVEQCGEGDSYAV